MCKLVCNLVPRPIHVIRVSGGGLEPNATAPGMTGNDATLSDLYVAYTKTARYSTKFTFKLFFLFTLYVKHCFLHLATGHPCTNYVQQFGGMIFLHDT